MRGVPLVRRVHRPLHADRARPLLYIQNAIDSKSTGIFKQEFKMSSSSGAYGRVKFVCDFDPPAIGADRP